MARCRAEGPGARGSFSAIMHCQPSPPPPPPTRRFCNPRTALPQVYVKQNKTMPSDPWEQLFMGIDAVFKCARRARGGQRGTAGGWGTGEGDGGAGRARRRLQRYAESSRVGYDARLASAGADGVVWNGALCAPPQYPCGTRSGSRTFVDPPPRFRCARVLCCHPSWSSSWLVTSPSSAAGRGTPPGPSSTARSTRSPASRAPQSTCRYI